MEQYSIDEIKKGFEILGLVKEETNAIEFSKLFNSDKELQTDKREIAKAPNSEPIIGSIVYGKLERSTR